MNTGFRELTGPHDHAKILHPDGIGKVILATKNQDAWSQTPVSVTDLDAAVRDLQGHSDVYISQNRFRDRRLISRLCQATSCFSDIDYYKTTYSGKDPKELADQILSNFDKAGLPEPNIIVSTGRGLLVNWLHTPIPRQALPRWNACQKYIYNHLKPLGADPQAIDAARVFRLSGTMHSGTGNMVQAWVYRKEPWPYEKLAETWLPYTRQELNRDRRKRLEEKPAAATSKGLLLYDRGTLWEGRLSELQLLRETRWPNGIPPGERDSWIFLAGVALAWITPFPFIEREIIGIALEATNWKWSEREVRSRMVSVLERTYQAATGKTIEWNGRKVSPLYRFKNETIVEWLGVTESEMRALNLKHLVSPKIRQENHQARWRQKWHKKQQVQGRGKRMTREEYEARAQERRLKARQMRDQGMSYRSIGEQLKCTEGEIRRLIKWGA